MRVKKSIEIANIIVDSYSISPETLSLVDFIREGGSIPAIKVQMLEHGQYKLKNGRHRITAYKLLGIKQIEAKFYDNDNKD